MAFVSFKCGEQRVRGVMSNLGICFLMLVRYFYMRQTVTCRCQLVYDGFV